MRRVRLTRVAADDIKRILRRSETDFGDAARARYKTLLDQAVRDLAEDPDRNGVKSIDDVRPGYFTYHIRWAKKRASGPPVRHPRHLLLFSMDDQGDVILGAIIHERELPARHLEGQ